MARRGGGAGGGLSLGVATVIAIILIANGKMDGFLDWVVALNSGHSSTPTATAPATVTAPAPGEPAEPSAPAPQPGTAAQVALSQLGTLAVLPTRPDVPGYERSCEKGKACSFGPAWSDNTTAPGSHNGCDSRNDVLTRSLTDVKYKSGSNCVVISGVLADPYTGKNIQFTKDKASAIQIDHLVPLAMAWDMGASSWTQEQRNAYANDEDAVLIAVDGPANNAKSDQGPGVKPQGWMPANDAYGCTYIERYIGVSAQYQLAVTAYARDFMAAKLATC